MAEFLEFDDVIGKMCEYKEKLEQCELIAMASESDRKTLTRRVMEILNHEMKGLYVLYEEKQAVYVGRSNSIAERLLMHGRQSSGPESATLAFIIAQEKFEKRYPNTKFTNRREQSMDTTFEPYFAEAKTRVKQMTVRVVAVKDDIEQAILEVYLHLKLKTKYNYFHNH